MAEGPPEARLLDLDDGERHRSGRHSSLRQPCGGETTIASAVSTALRVPLLTRDELAIGFAIGSTGLSGDQVRAAAEQALISVADSLAASGVTFVMESSVLDEVHLRPVVSRGASVLAVHVVAPPTVIGDRLRERITAGDAGMRRLLEQHEGGVMVPRLFEPSQLADSVVTVDTASGVPTSDHVAMVVDALGQLIG